MKIYEQMQAWFQNSSILFVLLLILAVIYMFIQYCLERARANQVYKQKRNKLLFMIQQKRQLFYRSIELNLKDNRGQANQNEGIYRNFKFQLHKFIIDQIKLMDKISLAIILALWVLVYLQETYDKEQFSFVQEVSKIRSRIQQQRDKYKIGININGKSEISYNTKKKLRSLISQEPFNCLFRINQSSSLQIQNSNFQAINYLISNHTESHIDTIHIVSIIRDDTLDQFESTWQERAMNVIQNIKRVYHIPEQSLRVNFVPLLKTRYNQNVFAKFQNQQYSQQIFRELLQSKQMSQCEFTWKKCKNYLIFQMQTLRDYYLQYQGIYLIPQLSQTNVKQILFQILDILPLKLLNKSVSQEQVSKTWYQFQYLKFLAGIQNQLRHLEYVSEMQGQYIHDQQEKSVLKKWQAKFFTKIFNYNEKNYQNLWQTGTVDILEDQRVGKMYLFPKDYKIGVLIPVLIIVFYPTLILLKKLASSIL